MKDCPNKLDRLIISDIRSLLDLVHNSLRLHSLSCLPEGTPVLSRSSSSQNIHWLNFLLILLFLSSIVLDLPFKLYYPPSIASDLPSFSLS